MNIVETCRNLRPGSLSCAWHLVCGHPRKEAIRLVIGKLQTGDIYEAAWRLMFGSWRQDERCKQSFNLDRLYILFYCILLYYVIFFIVWFYILLFYIFFVLFYIILYCFNLFIMLYYITLYYIVLLRHII